MLGKSLQPEENLAQRPGDPETRRPGDPETRRPGDNGESTQLTYPLANETKFQSIQSTNG